MGDDGGISMGDAASLGDMGFSEGDMGGFSDGTGIGDGILGDALGMLGDMSSLGEMGFGMDDMGMVQDATPSQAGQVADLTDDAFGKFSKALMNSLMGKALGPLGTASMNLGKAAMNPDQDQGKQQAAQSMFGLGKGMALGSLGPMGAAIGLGLGMMGPPTGPAQDNSASPTGNPMNDILGGLAGFYMGNRQAKEYGGAMDNLNSIFSPTGAYAQQLRQQLERKDAASGRRSQYGPREAQLMGMLADRQASTMSSPGYGNMMQQKMNGKNQGLNTLFGLMSKNPGLLQGAQNGIGSFMNGGGLGSLFNGGYSDNFAMGANAGPQLGSAFQGDDWWSGGEGFWGE